MENDPLDHWTDEDERAFQEYCRANPEWLEEARARAFARLYAEAEDDLLRAILR